MDVWLVIFTPQPDRSSFMARSFTVKVNSVCACTYARVWVCIHADWFCLESVVRKVSNRILSVGLRTSWTSNKHTIEVVEMCGVGPFFCQTRNIYIYINRQTSGFFLSPSRLNDHYRTCEPYVIERVSDIASRLAVCQNFVQEAVECFVSITTGMYKYDY